MVRYDQLAEFTGSLTGSPGVEDVPEPITKLLQKKQSRSSIDEICRKVYELEKHERKQQLLRVLENVGDIPRAMLGHGIREANSIDLIARQVRQLPRLATVHENEDDQSILQEYNLLREQIMKQCRAIEVASEVLEKSGSDLNTTRDLLQSIPDPRRFFDEYGNTLNQELKKRN